MATKKTFYAVVKGRQVGIFEKWVGGAGNSMAGFSGTVHEKFNILERAVKLLHEAGIVDISVHTGTGSTG